MLKWWVYPLIALFILDIIYRVLYNPKLDKNSINSSNFSQINLDTDLPQNISKKEKSPDIKYDKIKFDPKIMHFHSKKNNNNKKVKIIYEDEDIVYSKNNMKEIDEDDFEFEGLIPKPQKRLNVTIEYDEKYKDLYLDLTRQLDGNISYLDFYPKISNIQGAKKIIKYFLYFSIAIIFLCIFFIEKIINACCSGMKEGLKGVISTTKYLIFGFIYLFIMRIIKKISHTNLFEVYINRKLKYSTLKKEEPPTYAILFNILKNIDNN